MTFFNPYPPHTWQQWQQPIIRPCDHCFCKDAKEGEVIYDAQGELRGGDHKQCCMCSAFRHKSFLGGESDNTEKV